MAMQGPPNPPKGEPSGRAAGTTSEPPPVESTVNMIMQPPDPRVSADRGPVPLWIAIRNRRTDFTAYAEFITAAFGPGSKYDPPEPELAKYLGDVMNRRRTASRLNPVCADDALLGHGLGAYQLLKTATEIFLVLECGVFIAEYAGIAGVPGAEPTRVRGNVSREYLAEQLSRYFGGASEQRLPYIRKVLESLPDAKLDKLPFGDGFLKARVECPCFLELIWSYWHEEGMQVQGLNALSLRFQNRRYGDDRDPLSQLELSPLRPLSSILWGYVQDEQHRLTVARRNYEYEHEYGISLRGKAVPPATRIADRRSKFIEAFHDLLFRTALYYQQSANLQFNPDPFPLLNGLKEVHLLLSQGAGNQFGDLPWTARAEMLMQQWILARAEIKEFLGRRPMVAYPEAWMGNAETLKSMMGWTDTPIIHFRNLAVYGEQLLLSIRWTDWGSETDAQTARDWANNFRPELQGYMHAYRVATGVDLTLEPKDAAAAAARNESPSSLLERRLAAQHRGNGKA